MQQHYQIWLDAVNHSELSKYKKLKYLGIIRSLSETGAPVILSLKHLALLIGLDFGMLRRMYYARDRFYRSYSIKKRSGGERLIEAPYPSLKMVQRWILDNILAPSAIIHPSSVGFIRGKTIVDNALPHIGSDVILKMDIKDYFPSILEHSVSRYFNSLGYTISISNVLACLCCKDGRLPQGAPTSPMLSNVIPMRMDCIISDFAEMKSLVYTRYADDLTFSGVQIPISTIRAITEITAQFNFGINENKTRRSGKGARKIITGVSISSGHITIPRGRKRDIRQRAHYILTYGLLDHLRHIQSRDLLAGYRLLGELAYWHSVEPENEYVVSVSAKLKDLLRRA